MSTLLGTTLNGRYRLEARIGTGGMSSVYRAIDETLERPVAIKLMNREIATDSDQLERFRREARAVAQLSHPHIVGVIDYGEDQGRPYIVLEYVEGETLKERIRRNGELDVSEAVAYAIEIARALGCAHARHIVHRDVKPQNVLIDEEGSAKVTDFGIARSLDDDGLTADGRVLGTTDYVSPEQALGHDVTGQSDLYSLGIVLYEMLTGSVPFSGENQVAVAMKHVREELPDVQALRPEVSASLAAVIDRATAKDLHERYRSDEELIADLEDVLALEAARSGSATGEATTVLRTLPSRARRRVPLRVRSQAGLDRARGAAGGRRARRGRRPARRPHAPRHRDREDGQRRGDDAGRLALGRRDRLRPARRRHRARARDRSGDRRQPQHVVVDRVLHDRRPAEGGRRARARRGAGRDLPRAARAHPHAPASPRRSTSHAGTTLPDALDDPAWRLVATSSSVSGRQTIDLDTAGQRSRWVLLWITALPPDEDSVEISELSLYR